jgi:hypothetical protein
MLDQKSAVMPLPPGTNLEARPQADSMDLKTVRPVPKRKTTFYDKLDMLNKPPPSELGLSAIVEESRTWWPNLADPAIGKRVIELDAVKARAGKLDDNVPVVVDFEDLWDEILGRVRTLRLDIRENSAREVCNDIDSYRRLLRAYREGGFTGKLGAYAAMPNGEVNWNILNKHPRYAWEQRLWKSSNFFTAIEAGLIEDVDFVVPSLYAVGPDVNQHLEWCEATIDQAKSFGKPVIAYISPESHWAATGGFAKKLLSQPQWQGTLELIRRKEIDAVLWLGGDNRFKHDFAAGPEWWLLLEQLRNSWASEAIRTR